MIDVVTVGAGGGSVAWLSPEGTLKVGPRSAGADPGPMCYGRRRRADRHRRPRGARPDPAAPARRGDPAVGRRPPGPGWSGSAPSSACPWSGRRPASWRSPRGTRPTRCARSPCERGLDVRDFTLTTFGGSGSLLACRLIDILGLPRTLVPREPGQRLRVRAAHRRRPQRLRADRRPGAHRPRPRPGARGVRRPGGAGPHGAGRRRASPATRSGCSAPPTCATPGRPSRCGCRWPTACSTAGRPTPSRRLSTPRTTGSTGTTSPRDPRQAVEWVNLRVTGIGPIRRPELVRLRRRVRAGRTGPSQDRGRCSSTPTGSATPTFARRAASAPGTSSAGRP